MMTQNQGGKVLHPDLINPKVRNAQYAVRGELYLKGEALKKEGKDVVFTNVGNPHALGAKPLTFLRQVLSLSLAPFLLDNPKVHELYPADVIERVKLLVEKAPQGVGAYTDSRGLAFIREKVAKFIAERDGHPADPEAIYLTDGASPGVKMALQMLIRGKKDGILVPIPQYPLYSATIAMNGGTLVPYYMDESNKWGLSMDSIRQSIQYARREGVTVRAITIINPGNPTGNCLPYANLRELMELAAEEHLVVLADEVYQELTYGETPFTSCKKVLRECPPEIANELELISFHTVSKGTTGECGLRGGYFELVNLHPGTLAEYYKAASINLCPNTVGQLAVWSLVDPPQEGQPSYDLFMEERKAEFASLQRRAELSSNALAALEGIKVNPTEGAMYIFPQIELPTKAIEAAAAAGKAPDVFYCLEMLDSTGIVAIPGSGFGQAPGTFHFRSSILPQEDVMRALWAKFKEFHLAFLEKYK